MDIRSERTSGNFFTFAFGKDSIDYYFLRVRGGDVRSAITGNSWQNESAVTGSTASGNRDPRQRRGRRPAHRRVAE
ncbi:hypothetical protein [Microbacterium aurantiacum]|uniref:hypothetical protein n=1 Tax=Microbacterium aurantiacum TaxID=162393 RepID=UPI003D72B41B